MKYKLLNYYSISYLLFIVVMEYYTVLYSDVFNNHIVYYLDIVDITVLSHVNKLYYDKINTLVMNHIWFKLSKLLKVNCEQLKNQLTKCDALLGGDLIKSSLYDVSKKDKLVLFNNRSKNNKSYSFDKLILRIFLSKKHSKENIKLLRPT